MTYNIEHQSYTNQLENDIKLFYAYKLCYMSFFYDVYIINR